MSRKRANNITNPVLTAVEKVGSSLKVAQLYSPPLSRQAVDKWVMRGCVPSKRVKELSRATGVP